MQADPLKIAAVQRYLESKFSGCEIGHRQDSDKGLEVFTIEAEPDGRMFTVKVAHAFLDDYKPQGIALKLDQWQIGDFVKVSGLWPILVTPEGIQSIR